MGEAQAFRDRQTERNLGRMMYLQASNNHRCFFLLQLDERNTYECRINLPAKQYENTFFDCYFLRNSEFLFRHTFYQLNAAEVIEWGLRTIYTSEIGRRAAVKRQGLWEL